MAAGHGIVHRSGIRHSHVIFVVAFVADAAMPPDAAAAFLYLAPRYATCFDFCHCYALRAAHYFHDGLLLLIDAAYFHYFADAFHAPMIFRRFLLSLGDSCRYGRFRLPLTADTPCLLCC